jgi:hypothetical protein
MSTYESRLSCHDIFTEYLFPCEIQNNPPFSWVYIISDTIGPLLGMAGREFFDFF